MPALYDRIGESYTTSRRVEPRFAMPLVEALGSAESILNVGAGTGSYEPAGRTVVAVDPSAVMIAQRARGAAPDVQARSEGLPFRDDAFDAVMAVLTIHHWAGMRAGLAECARVASRRVVLITWDPASEGFWLVQEYFPEILEIDRALFPSMDTLAEVLGDITVRPLPVPADCADGFLGAFWQRPQAYLDPRVRNGMSVFSRLADVNRGLGKLRNDLGSGSWLERHGRLLKQDTLDIGYKLIIAGESS